MVITILLYAVVLNGLKAGSQYIISVPSQTGSHTSFSGTQIMGDVGKSIQHLNPLKDGRLQAGKELQFEPAFRVIILDMK